MAITRPRWATTPPVGYAGVVEPSEGKKDEGFQNGEEPAAGTFNWLLQNLANWVSDAVLGDPNLASILRADIATLSEKREVQSILSALASQWSAGGVFSGPATAIECISEHNRTLGAFASGTAHLPLLALVKTNSMYTGAAPIPTSIGSVTGVLNAVAIAPDPGTGSACAMAVGNAGVWYQDFFNPRTGAHSVLNGSISGGPNLTEIIYDAAHNYFWASGPSGNWLHYTTWLPFSASAFVSKLVCLPSGRVLMVTSAGVLWYSDDAIAMTVGATLPAAPICAPVYDSALGMAIYISDTHVYGTVDGTSTVTLATMPAGGVKSLFRFRGRACLCWRTTSPASCTFFTHISGGTVWYGVEAPQLTIALGGPIAGCRDLAATCAGLSYTILITPPVIDVSGSL